MHISSRDVLPYATNKTEVWRFHARTAGSFTATSRFLHNILAVACTLLLRLAIYYQKSVLCLEYSVQMVSVADILHRTVVIGCVGVSLWGIGTGFAVHTHTMKRGQGALTRFSET